MNQSILHKYIILFIRYTNLLENKSLFLFKLFARTCSFKHLNLKHRLKIQSKKIYKYPTKCQHLAIFKKQNAQNKNGTELSSTTAVVLTSSSEYKSEAEQRMRAWYILAPPTEVKNVHDNSGKLFFYNYHMHTLTLIFFVHVVQILTVQKAATAVASSFHSPHFLFGSSSFISFLRRLVLFLSVCSCFFF